MIEIDKRIAALRAKEHNLSIRLVDLAGLPDGDP